MIFPYEIYRQYISSNNLVAFFVGAIEAGFLIPVIADIIRTKTLDFRKYVVNLFIAFIGVATIYAVAPSLVNGGIALSFEDESDAVICSGMIDHIQSRSQKVNHARIENTFAYGDNSYLQDGDIYINGQWYYVLSVEGLQVGEYVEYRYLPLSKYILEISPYNDGE